MRGKRYGVTYCGRMWAAIGGWATVMEGVSLKEAEAWLNEAPKYREIHEDNSGYWLITNNHFRDLHCAEDVDPKIVKEWFDYLSEEDLGSPRLFEYRGSWYDANEFDYRDRNSFPSTVHGWDGVQCESAFSAVLIRYDDDYEAVAVAYMHW